MEDSGKRCVPNLHANHPGGEFRCGASRSLYQSSGSVRANSGEHAIMASYPRAHAENVKEPRTVRSKKRRLKIEMEKSMSFGPPVAAQKFQQGRAAKMMNNSGGQIKLAGMIGRE